MPSARVRHIWSLLFAAVLLVQLAPPAIAQSTVPPSQETAIYLPLAVNPGSIDGEAPVDAAAIWANCQPDGVQESGAIYRICMPPAERYNGDLVIWAHGYVDITKPVQIPEGQLCFGGVCIPDIVNTLGFGFITTSYSVNGLAVRQGLADVVDLVDVYTREVGAPNQVFVIGASEGGIITALAAEQHPDLFAGGVAMCGPVGNFQRQINYFGDFRVLFDYFFPGIMPGTAIDIPPELLENWDAFYAAAVAPVINDPANLPRLLQLLDVSNLPYDPNDFVASVNISVEDALWYNVFATMDAMNKLGGQPYDNTARVYLGSQNDELLNASVARYAADPAALAEIGAYYQTTGLLDVPLVTLHTLLDQQVPYWHEPVYGTKVLENRSAFQRVNIPVNRYRHCNFRLYEPLVAFGILYFKATGHSLDMSAFAPRMSGLEWQSFRALAREYGLPGYD